MSDNFWIPISFTESDTPQKIYRAIVALQDVHTWTVEYLNKCWVEENRIPYFKDYRPYLWQFIEKEQLARQTQQYSLHRTAEKSFAYFSDEIRENQFPVIPIEIDWIQIEARKVWRKYIPLYETISTCYGAINLPEINEDSNWKRTLREQGNDVEPDLIPFLWHSITVQTPPKGWRLHFNLHIEKRFIKQAKKELKETYADTPT